MKYLLTILSFMAISHVHAQAWKEMIAPAQFGTTDEQQFTILENNRPVMATIQNGSGEPKVYGWDGKVWFQYPQIVAVPVTDIQVTHDGAHPIVGFYHTILGKYQVYTYDGSNWNIIGDTGVLQYHPGSVRLIRSANPTDLFINYSELGTQDAYMKKWDGFSWLFHGANYDPAFSAINKVVPGSEGSKVWTLHEDQGNGELRAYSSDEFSPTWSYYTLSPVDYNPIHTDLDALQGQFPTLAYVTSGSPDDIIVRQPDGSFYTDFTPINIAGGVDEIGCAMDDASVPYVYFRETLSTEGKVVKEDGAGGWLTVGNQVHSNGSEGDLQLFRHSKKPYLKYKTDSNEPRLSVFNTPPSFGSDSGIQSVCQDDVGATVYSTITFTDSDHDSLFISAISNSPALITSANIMVTRTNTFSSLSSINDFKIDVTPQSGMTGIANIDLHVIDGIDTLTYPIAVTINGLPTVGAGVDQTVCQGTAVTLSGSGAVSYTWDNSVIDGSAFTPGVGSIVYTVTGTDGNNCQNTDMATVTVNANPAFSYGHDDVTCNGLNDGTLNLNGLIASQSFDVYYDLGTTVGPINLSSDTFGDLIVPSLGPGSYTNIQVVDANGCSFSVPGPELINEPSALTSNPLSDQFICDGDITTLNGSAAGGTPTYAYNWDNGVTDGVSFSPSVGTITYNLTITDANGCTALDNVDITVYALPTVDAGVDQTVCDGSPVTLNGSGASTYSWDNGVIDGSPFTPSVGSLVYTVTGTDVNSCQNTDVVTVTVNANPTFSVSTTNATCFGNSDGSLILTGVPGGLAYDVYYDLGSTVGPLNLTASGGGDIIIPGLGAGSYTNINVIDANGCTGFHAGPEIISQPTAVVSNPISDQFICDGDMATLNGSGTGGTPGYTYTWDNGVTDGVPFSPSVGTITYNLTITDANGCIGLDNTDITVYALPTVDAGLDQTVCENDQVTLNGSGAISYTWDNGVSDGISFPAIAGVTVYTVTGTDGNSCQNTDMMTLTVNALPTVNAGTDQTVCENVGIILSGSGASSYVWDNGVSDGLSFNQSPGLITYTVTGTDANGCVNTDMVDVTSIPAPPVFTTSSTDPLICGAADGTITLSGLLGSTNYDIYYDNPTTMGPFNMTSTPGGDIVLTGLTAGSYSNFNVVAGNGCSTLLAGPENLSDPAAPTVIAGADQTICEGESVVLIATNPDNALISWDNFVTDGVPTSPATTTTYTVTASSSGCVSSDQLTVTVNPLPSISIVTTDENCGATDGTATATISSGSAPYSIYWSNGSTANTAVNLSATFYYINVTDANNCYAMDVATISSSSLSITGSVTDNNCAGDQNGAIDLSVSGTGPFLYYWSNGAQVEDITGLAAGQYEVYVQDATGCSSTASFVVAEPSSIVSNYTTNAATCGVNDGIITAAITGGTAPYTYQWLDENQINIAGATSSILSTAGAGIYYLNISDANNCSSQMTTVLSEIGAPIVTADSLMASTCANDGFINININTSNTIVSTIWSTGQTTEDITNIGDGVYSVTVVDNNGCAGLASFTVGQIKPAAIPICIVTVDSVTNTNKVIWEKPVTSDISEFRIYRESSIAGSFQFVDAVNYDSLSEYNDTIAYPELRSWRYVLTTVDTCGVESLPSEDHKTIHYTRSNDGAGNYELFWDEYEGFTYPSYHVWRHTDVNGWEEIHTELFGGTLYLADTPPSEIDLDYVVIVSPPSICTSTLTKATDYNSSRSNKNGSGSAFFDGDDDSGINEASILVDIYPNPTEGNITVHPINLGVYNVEIVDLRGRSILSYSDVKGETTLDLSHVESGSYFVKITSDMGNSIQKIIKH